jgi:carboxymethylenebutenolidase
MRLQAVLTSAVFTLAASSAAGAADYTTQTLSVGVRKNMEATLYTPNGPGPFPQIMVLHTSGGISSFDQGYCGNLAKEGYICIVPAFLRAHGITNETRYMTFTKDRQAILDDFRQIGREVLSQHPKAKPGSIGVIGFSNGGYFAALMAGAGRIRAGVSYYGTFTGANSDPQLKRMTAVFKASSSPLLILAGENDTTIGTEVPRKLDAIAKAAGAPCELKMYPATGHDFERSGTTGSQNAASAADAWQRTLAFLRANGM